MTRHPPMLYILCRVFGWSRNSTRWLSTPYSTLWLLAFPRTKITFEREEILDSWWDSGKCNRAADGDWKNCVRSQVTSFEGDWSITVLCTMFLISCIFFNKRLYFSYYIAGYLKDLIYFKLKLLCLIYNNSLWLLSIQFRKR